MIEERFVGRGLVFPIVVTPSGGVQVSSGTELINASIKMILGWDFLQRIFLSPFGSRCVDLLEEPNDPFLKQLVQHFAYEALNRWEARIILLSVQAITTDDKSLKLEISYRIKSSGLEHTFVYPYYRQVIY